jgi:hypothetical protein
MGAENPALSSMSALKQNNQMKRICYLLLIVLSLQACQKDSGTSGQGVMNSGSGTGQGGSLARFTIARNHLFIVDNYELYSYSLANSERPQLKGKVHVGFEIETIYSYEDKLFIGSQNAMYIYSIADPGQPARLGTASHVRACDPVVANDTLAYVTVRSGSNCGGMANSLLVYDVRNTLNPVLRNTVPMNSPWGLGLKGNRLYVCDGPSGLVVYELSDPVRPRVVQRLAGETFYDVIPTDNVLVAMVQGGTALYRYRTGDSIQLASKMVN